MVRFETRSQLLLAAVPGGVQPSNATGRDESAFLLLKEEHEEQTVSGRDLLFFNDDKTLTFQDR